MEEGEYRSGRAMVIRAVAKKSKPNPASDLILLKLQQALLQGVQTFLYVI